MAKTIPVPTSPSPFPTSRFRMASSLVAPRALVTRNYLQQTSGISQTCLPQQEAVPSWDLGN